MLVSDFETLLQQGLNIDAKLCILDNQEAKKWYDKKYTHLPSENIKENTVYGVSIGGFISYDFKTPKNLDNLLKTFITQYATKTKKFSVDTNGNILTLKKEDIIQDILQTARKNKVYERFYHFLSYTTLYGFGVWAILASEEDFQRMNSKIEKFLRDKKIEYTNEYSDAFWAYRYKFKGMQGKIKEINSLMLELQAI